MTKKTNIKVKLSKRKPNFPRTRRSLSKKKKTFNPLPLIFLIILVVTAFLGYEPIMKAISEPNKEPVVVKKEVPKKIVKKAIPKKEVPKKAIPKKEVPKSIVKEIPKYVAPAKVFFKGEIKHYSFKGVVEKHCFSCHGEEGKEIEGKFNFVKFLAGDAQNQKIWKAVYDEVIKGNMPPEEEEPLNELEKEVFLAEIKKMTSVREITRKTRLLTPNEIKNTVSDLFQIDSEVYNPFTKLAQNYSTETYYTCQEDRLTPFYLDDLFTTLNDAINSYVSLDAQLKPLKQTARFIGDINFGQVRDSTAHLLYDSGGRFARIDFERVKSKREQSEDTRLAKNMTKEQLEYKKQIESRTLPPGNYVLTFDGRSMNLNPDYYSEKNFGPAVISQYKNLLKEHPYSLPIEFFAVPPDQADAFAKSKHLSTVEVDSSENSSYTIKFNLSRRSAIGYRYATPMPGRGIAAKIVRHHEPENTDIPFADIQKYEKKYIYIKNIPLAHVRLGNLKIEGPFDVQVNNYSFDKNDRVNDLEVRKKFRNLHTDASMQNNTVYSYIFSKLKQSKLDSHESYRTAMASFFMSPDFLTVINDKKDKNNYPRFVSYALHKSHPTKEFIDLLEKAQRSRDPRQLTEWMISHKNFERFLEAFSYQWLDIAQILTNQPGENTFGAFHLNNLFEAYQTEASQFLLHLYRNNLPIKEMVTANYSFVNEDINDIYSGGRGQARLKKNWKPKAIHAGEFKKTEFSNANRGGLLSMGAFLSATGNGVDGLPLRRAKWILENLLDAKLPPVPADIDVEAFESDKAGNTLLEKLEAHTKDPACHSCHKRMDPLAIMMDQFNTIGGTNHNYSRETVMINDQKINSIADLKLYIGSHEAVLARAFTKNILQFTLGRELYVQDETKLTQIIEENKTSGFKIRDLLSSVVKYYFL